MYEDLTLDLHYILSFHSLIVNNYFPNRDKDKLYIPVEKIEFINKYSNGDGAVPKLNKLGSTEWEKTKLRVKKKIENIAGDLLKLYAERERTQGFAFSKDTEEQAIFESHFPYEETADQLKVIEEIKSDMEKPVPMDRLLCVDVERKQCILVDHNEYEQSVDGLNQADIVEIIDHHKIGSIGTNAPINFRNMPLGSTNTILYLMYKEHHIEIPKSIAGIMLSGILSDTLILKSPTSTKMDEEAIKVLSKIAEVDYEEYGMKMFKAASSLEGMTKEQVLYSDFKNFHMNDFVVGIGQVLTLDIDQIKQVEEEYIVLLDQEAENKGYDVVGLFITDIIHQGSYIYFNHSSKDIWRKSFHMNDLEEGTFIEGCISRKKQMVPAIMKVLDK